MTLSFNLSHLFGLNSGRTDSLLVRVTKWNEMHKQRIALGKLDLHLLNDIGVSHEEAQKEAKKPVWQAPGHWMR